MFSKRLKQLRLEANLSQKDLANIFFVSQQAVGKWEAGRSYPSAELMPKIAAYFNVPIDYLFGNDSSFSKNTEQQSSPSSINDDTLKAAFYGDYSDKLSPAEVDELWEDAKEYALFKAQQRINKKD